MAIEFELTAVLDANWEFFTCQLPHSSGFGVYGTSTMFLTALCVSAEEEGGTGTAFVTGAIDGLGGGCDLLSGLFLML